MSNEKQSLAIIEPQNMSELRDFAEDAADSKLYGLTAPQALMVSMRGRDLGFSYTQALSAFHIIEGKPTLTADGMVAACLRSGKCEFFRVVESTETKATWETKRHGDDVKRYSFTIEDAKAAGLMESKSRMYQKYPKRMLSARAKAYLARDTFADVLLGLITDDEAHERADHSPPNASAPKVTVERIDEPKGDETKSKARKTYHGAKMIDALKLALDDSSSLDRVDAIFSSFGERRAILNVEDDARAMELFASARARIESADKPRTREPGED